MPKKVNRIVVIDLECTCWENPNDKTPEIIEIGACLYNNRTNEITNNINLIVRPRNLDISEYCTNLTSLTEKVVLRGVWLEEALGTLKKDLPLRSCPWGSWGDFDRIQLEKECIEKAIEYPLGRTHLNISFLFSFLMKDKVGSGLGKAISRLGMIFEGTPHKAAHDAYNTARVLRQLSEFELPPVEDA